MIFYDKRVLSIFTVYFLVILTFTTGQEGHENKTVLQSTANSTSDTQNLNLRNSSHSDYVWSNNDDYDDDDGYSNDEPASEPEDGKLNGTDTGVVVVSESKGASNSEKAPESEDSSKPPQNESISSSVSPSPSIESSAPVTVTGSTTDAGNSSISDIVTTTPPTTVDDSDSASSTDSSENEGSSSTPKPSPNPIVTEDLGDLSNYTSTQVTVEKLETSAFRTWALAIFSVLISFAAIFTILFFIRNALIRRRRADQRRLLRGSISSEGYFYGDGDGSSKGNFEL